MNKWICVDDELPPFHERVLIYCTNTRLLDWNRKSVTIYLAAREPDKIDGNNERNFSWRAENSDHYCGQDVLYWKRLDYPPPHAYSIVCPTCNAAIGGKCLDPVRDGCQYRSDPHPERIEASKNVV